MSERLAASFMSTSRPSVLPARPRPGQFTGHTLMQYTAEPVIPQFKPRVWVAIFQQLNRSVRNLKPLRNSNFLVETPKAADAAGAPDKTIKARLI